MYPIYLPDVANALLEDKRRVAAGRRLAQAVARANRKNHRGVAGHKPASASAELVEVVPAQASDRERELTCAAR
jgi:hypothetical protein